jgi:hypothetical protein
VRCVLLAALLASGCFDEAQPFTFRVTVVVTDDITAVTADGQPAEISSTRLVDVQRVSPSYRHAEQSRAIEFVFFARDRAAHRGHAHSGQCAQISLLFDCPIEEFVSEHITISDYGYQGPPGGYLDFAVGVYDSIGCTACGSTVIGSP